VKATKLAIRPAERTRALNALRYAILAGTTYEYERLVNLSLQAGATDEDIDLLIHDALQMLFQNAEQPVGPREMASFRPLALVQ